MSVEENVAVRRKSDGLYLQRPQARGHVHWGDKPAFVKTRAKATVIIRVDAGMDLDEVEFVPRSLVEKAARKTIVAGF